MKQEKDKNLIRFLLTFFLGWIGSLIINMTELKPQGFRSRTLEYFLLSIVTFGIYGIVAAISNLSFDPAKEKIIGYVREDGVSHNSNSYTNVTSQEELIKKYKEMLDNGVITEEEFNAKRKQILGI